MNRDIVVFETNEEEPKLDFRLIRRALPSDSSPLAIIEDNDGYSVSGQHFTKEEVIKYARTQSGYPLGQK